jgi:phospholipase D1/2
MPFHSDDVAASAKASDDTDAGLDAQHANTTSGTERHIEKVDDSIDDGIGHSPPRRLVGLGIFVLTLALGALAWRYTPLGKWINFNALIELARSVDDMPFTPLAVIGFYAIAGLLIPITLLIAVTGVVFGPLYGALYAIVGSLSSAVLTYQLGKWIGRSTVQQYLGARVNRLSKRIAQRGILAMAIIRVLPIAPFTVVNVIAGTSHIGLRDYMLGTMLGMTPGIVLTVTFIHHLTEAVRNPSPQAFAILAAVGALMIGCAIGLQKLFDRIGASRHP